MVAGRCWWVAYDKCACGGVLEALTDEWGDQHAIRCLACGWYEDLDEDDDQRLMYDG